MFTGGLIFESIFKLVYLFQKNCKIIASKVAKWYHFVLQSIWGMQTLVSADVAVSCMPQMNVELR